MDNLFQTHKDALDGMLAAFDDIPNEELSFEQDCHERVKLALFFDGTGNNRDADAPTKSWSNVARLYEAARDEPKKGIYRYYISGVGTKLNREEPWWHLNKHPRDSAALGGGTGWGAGSRLQSGDISINDALKQALERSSKLASEEIEAVYKANEKEAFAKLNEALSKHRLIRSIDISVFGFSRGAALARAFVNRLLKACEKEGGELTYEGYPIRFRFLGIFDTVASFGRPAKNNFKKIEMLLPQELEKCVHYVAAHELRYSFPVDLIRQEGTYPREDWIETVFPGVHSDVGGGYRPGAQGKSDELARIPLLNMYVKSLASGARFRDWSEISEDKPLRDKFGLSRGVQSTYKAYMEAVGQQAKTGTIEEQIKAHMEHWYAYMGALESGEAELELDRQEQAHEIRIEQFYTDSSVFDLQIGKSFVQGHYRKKSGGGSVVGGVKVPVGKTTVSWFYDTFRGDPRARTEYFKRDVEVVIPKPSKGDRFLGVHIYPGDIVEFSLSNGIPGKKKPGEPYDDLWYKRNDPFYRSWD